MTRILVTATADATSLELKSDDRAFNYSPNDVVPIGFPTQHYFVAPMRNKPHVWGWWPISYEMADRLRLASANKNGHPGAGYYYKLVRQIVASRPERVAANDNRYLFALTSDSANNGILHPYRPKLDPIRQALESIGCNRKTGRIIPLSQAKGLFTGYYSAPIWRVYFTLTSDGSITTRPAHVDEAPSNAQDVRELTETTGTYVIQLYEGWNETFRRRVITVAAEPSANREVIAQAIVQLVREQSRLLSGPELNPPSV